MNYTRARFEEIWPVPECAEWSDYFGKYLQAPNTWATIGAVAAYNARLDTFTRCQETTSIHLSLIDELVNELEIDRNSQSWSGGKGDNYPCLIKCERQSNLIERVRQVTGAKE